MSYSKNRQGQTTVFQTEPERVPIPFGLVAIAALPVIFFLFISLTASVVFAVIFAALIWARMKVFPAAREKGGDISSRQEFGPFDSPARKSTLVVRLLLILVGGMIGPAQPAWAAPNPFNTGDVFVAISNGKVQHRDSTGLLIETLDTLQGGFTTGMAIDAEGSLYVTNFGAGNVVKFNNKGERVGIFGSGYSGSPESIVFDRAGNSYVGAVNGDNGVRKFDPQGIPLARYNVATEARGSDWVDLAADQCTLFYTSEGSKALSNMV